MSTVSPPSKTGLWIGRVLSALPTLMLLMSSFMLISRHPEAVKGFAEFGYPEKIIFPLGCVVLTSTVLYAIPYTAMWGAILLTGFLGGATATHVRADDGRWFFPVIFAGVIWLGLLLRDSRLRQLIPLRKL